MIDRTANTQFDPQRFERQLAMTDFTRRALLTIFIAGYIGSYLPGFEQARYPYMAMFLAIGGWIAASFASARTARLAQHAARLAGSQAPPEQTESALREVIGRFTLYRAVRLTVYQHLAMLRHRQGRFAESSAICSALLSQDDRQLTASVRTTLTMMFTEDRLQLNDLPGAYGGLASLHQQQLSMVESVQALLLELRYEAACGYDQQLLWNLPARFELIDMMPPPASAMCHRLLAGAAERSGLRQIAAYLRNRAELLVGPEEVASTITQLTPLSAPPAHQ